MNQTEDKTIIEMFFSRNEKALQETEQKYGKNLSYLAYHILRNQEDAEEAVSDTYLNAWNSIPPQKPASLFAYLAKLCRNNALDKLDRKHAQKRNAEIVALSEEMEMCIPDNLHSMENSLNENEISEYINEFLKTLSKENRIIFMRRYWFSESIKEIADNNNLSQSKVKTSLHRTRKKLRDFLERKEFYI